MSWEEIVSWCSALLDKPIVIAGVSIGTVGAIGLFALSKTNFGKRTVRAVKSGFDTLKVDFTNLISRFDTLKTDLSTQISEYKHETEEKVQLLNETQNDLKTLVLAIAENSHNKNVQDAVNNYLEKCKEKDIEIKQRIEEATTQLQTYKEKLEFEYGKLLNQMQNKIYKLENKLNEKEKELGCRTEKEIQEN